MSRSGYDDSCDGWDLIRWRGAVRSAIRGRRGQTFLREMLAAMDGLPAPRLIAHELIEDSEVCAIGSVMRARGLDVSEIDPGEREEIAWVLGIAEALVAEVAFQNDECAGWEARPWIGETPEQRFTRMRRWVVRQLGEEDTDG